MAISCSLKEMCKQLRTILAITAQRMLFTVEQIFLANPRIARPLAEPQYHVVEADDVDTAVGTFLTSSSASLVGSVQKLPGAHAVATARTSDDVVFTINVLPGSDVFRR